MKICSEYTHWTETQCCNCSTQLQNELTAFKDAQLVNMVTTDAGYCLDVQYNEKLHA